MIYVSKPWLAKQEEVKTIEVEGVRVTYKELSYGAQRRIGNETLTIDEKGNPKIDFTLLTTLQTVESIVDWDFTDEKDNKLPITLHTFDEVLSPEFGGLIVKAVSAKVNTKVPTEDEKKQ